MRKKVLLVVGTRPNFMKAAPIWRALFKTDKIDVKIVHTGQHYDFEMSEVFLREVDMQKPSYWLEVGSGSQAVQTSKVMIGFEKVCEREVPDAVVVVGDVNSTIACALVAKKAGVIVCHVEAGLRSFDTRMPEEINRILTDAISDYCFVTEESGVRNLMQEGKRSNQIHFVGNVMIDNLMYQMERLPEESSCSEEKSKYAFVTLHRKENVDDCKVLAGIVAAIGDVARDMQVVFPVHPRTKKMLSKFGLTIPSEVSLRPPLGFREALCIWKDAVVVLTDSGGLQEETTALGIPCVTMRDSTERPITIELGSNVLGGTKRKTIVAAYRKAMLTKKKVVGCIVPKWDGCAAKRIAEVVDEMFD